MPKNTVEVKIHHEIAQHSHIFWKIYWFFAEQNLTKQENVSDAIFMSEKIVGFSWIFQWIHAKTPENHRNLTTRDQGRQKMQKYWAHLVWKCQNFDFQILIWQQLRPIEYSRYMFWAQWWRWLSKTSFSIQFRVI